MSDRVWRLNCVTTEADGGPVTDASSHAPLRVAVIIGTTRENRMGEAIGRWFVTEAEKRDDIGVDLIDLVDFELPNRYPELPTDAMTAFASRVGNADAFVIVTPEYNYSFTGSLKQAIDCAYDEWHAKPVGFVSYGCRSTGRHAVEQLRTVFTYLHATTMRDVVSFDLLTTTFTGDGGLRGDDGQAGTAEVMLNQLAWWGLALRKARAARPYVS
ncbi:NAD(P)H-dependent oxidoreductase [Solwaraspora sp. WMMA2056]|uniref:NADPH-dependent FMN reductase n=1 Tax=Solwaraspora sp. WMMA2056 TaxID=3015161 RepID=UPI00259BB20E|nr:NAD(P)H-dependent oxidoreductase [Solwaraspora sp. WMMA2056]WJK42564.1 NAD(P)H-dependent oxidoreductase [Solwaraspora sp. WMMA2056]